MSVYDKWRGCITICSPRFLLTRSNHFSTSYLISGYEQWSIHLITIAAKYICSKEPAWRITLFCSSCKMLVIVKLHEAWLMNTNPQSILNMQIPVPNEILTWKRTCTCLHNLRKWHKFLHHRVVSCMTTKNSPLHSQKSPFCFYHIRTIPIGCFGSSSHISLSMVVNPKSIVWFISIVWTSKFQIISNS